MTHPCLLIEEAEVQCLDVTVESLLVIEGHTYPDALRKVSTQHIRQSRDNRDSCTNDEHECEEI